MLLEMQEDVKSNPEVLLDDTFVRPSSSGSFHSQNTVYEDMVHQEEKLLAEAEWIPDLEYIESQIAKVKECVYSVT